MKRTLIALLALLTALCAPPGALAAPNGLLTVQVCDWDTGTYADADAARVALTLNGAPLEGDVPALIQGDRTLVPVRLVGEALSAQVLWVQETGQVILVKGEDLIVLTVDSGTALVNGAAKELPGGVPAQVVRYAGADRTMVPLRFVSEELGAEVTWDQATYTAHLTADLPQEVPPQETGPAPEEPSQPPEEPGGEGPEEETPEETPEGAEEPEPPAGPLVTAIQVDPQAQAVTIAGGPGLEHRIAEMGDRVVVDLPGALLEGFPYGTVPVDGPLLAEVRYALHGPELYSGHDHTVRVVLELQPGAAAGNIRVEEGESGLRLTAVQGSAHTQPVRPETFTVVIDPGHGGESPGAWYEGVSEKDIDLAVSLKLEALLEELGYQVVMTRSSDVSIGLYERADLANAAGADLFVSIHANAAEGRPDYQGIFTYYHPTSSRGARLAQAIQGPLCEATGGIDRGIRSADFVVLRETSMCAVLVEMGFMSSPEELARLLDDAYQDQLAWGIAEGIIRYLNAQA